MFFEEIIEAAPDPIFGMVSTFQADPRPNKISLMVGVYKDNHLQTVLMPIVKSVKQDTLAQDETADYLPIDGLPEFYQQVGALVFGKTLWEHHHSRIYATQTVGGTGALRLGADLIVQEFGKKLYLPQPTWSNHRNIFTQAGFVVESLPYYSQELHQVDARAYLQAIQGLKPNSILLLHACCHNPTGSDPSFEVWKQISAACKEKSILPFFDFAYQGLGQGVEEDAKVIRMFLEEGHEFLVAYSCSKNFSLYCQRVGALFVVSPNAATKFRIGTQIKRLIRTFNSNPPAHGARIVAHILKHHALRASWEQELSQMRHRITHMRKLFLEKLAAKSTKRDFSFLQGHNGMFSYLDLTKSQVQELIDKYALYTLDSGRINIAGITTQNLDQIVNHIVAVC